MAAGRMPDPAPVRVIQYCRERAGVGGDWRTAAAEAFDSSRTSRYRTLISMKALQAPVTSREVRGHAWNASVTREIGVGDVKLSLEQTAKATPVERQQEAAAILQKVVPGQLYDAPTL